MKDYLEEVLNSLSITTKDEWNIGGRDLRIHKQRKIYSSWFDNFVATKITLYDKKAINVYLWQIVPCKCGSALFCFFKGSSTTDAPGNYYVTYAINETERQLKKIEVLENKPRLVQLPNTIGRTPFYQIRVCFTSGASEIYEWTGGHVEGVIIETLDKKSMQGDFIYVPIFMISSIEWIEKTLKADSIDILLGDAGQ